jgi:hypothetical protein
MEFFKEVIHRFRAKTPKFFKILRNIGASVVVLTATIASLEQLGMFIPDWITNVLNAYTALSGLMVSLISQLTAIWKTEDGLEINNKPYN